MNLIFFPGRTELAERTFAARYPRPLHFAALRSSGCCALLQHLARPSQFFSYTGRTDTSFTACKVLPDTLCEYPLCQGMVKDNYPDSRQAAVPYNQEQRPAFSSVPAEFLCFQSTCSWNFPLQFQPQVPC